MPTAQPQSDVRAPRQVPQRPPLQVLILDDERVDRYRLARLCSGLPLPCQISNAKTLAEFDGLLERESYGLILLDYMLPDGTGLDALDRIRLSARNLNTPALMVTGLDPARISTQANAAGCAGFLSKDDLTPERFGTAIESILGTTEEQALLAKTRFSVPDVERLMALCASRTIREVKPMVSRLMRQLRDQRGNADTLEAMEQNCMSLWMFLIELEQHGGGFGLDDLLADAPLSAVPGRKERRSKPPSPFSARTQ